MHVKIDTYCSTNAFGHDVGGNDYFWRQVLVFFRKRLVRGRFLSSTYVAPAPPSQDLALEKAMIHLRQNPQVSHSYTFVFKIGLEGEERPLP